MLSEMPFALFAKDPREVMNFMIVAIKDASNPLDKTFVRESKLNPANTDASFSFSAANTVAIFAPTCLRNPSTFSRGA